MLCQAGLAKDREEGEAKISEALHSGAAFESLCAFFEAQGGDVSYLRDPSKFPTAAIQKEILAEQDGYVSSIASLDIGISAMKLGAGRATMDDVIDMSAGIVLRKKVGDRVEKGEVLAVAHTNKTDVDAVYEDIKNAFVLTAEKVVVPPVVHRYLSE